MKEAPNQQSALWQDTPAYVIGGTGIAISKIEEITNIVQAIGIWFGTGLVILTFCHRAYSFWKDTKK